MLCKDFLAGRICESQCGGHAASRELESEWNPVPVIESLAMGCENIRSVQGIYLPVLVATTLLGQIVETYFVVMACDGIERLAKGAAEVSIAAKTKCLVASSRECRKDERCVGLYEQSAAATIVRTATGIELDPACGYGSETEACDRWVLKASILKRRSACQYTAQPKY